MSDKLDPYSEGFLRTCYDNGVPEELACRMLIKAASMNARQPGNLPIGDVGRLALFGAGQHVVSLVKSASDTQTGNVRATPTLTPSILPLQQGPSPSPRL